MSTLAVPMAPAGTSGIWSVATDRPGRRLFHDARRAAMFIADEAYRREQEASEAPLTVHLLEDHANEPWDASADVAAVLTAARWPREAGQKGELGYHRLRNEVVTLLDAILVSE